MIEMETRVGTQERLGDGTVIETRFTQKPLSVVDPSDTAIHELEHGILAPDKVVEISVIPGPGYLGKTEMSSYDDVAFAGPASQKRSGVSHDLSVIDYKGDSPEAAQATARIMLASIDNRLKMQVAGHLQAEGTLSGGQFRNAIRRFSEGEIVEVTVTTPDGQKETTTEKGVKGEVIIVDFSKIEPVFEDEDEESEDTAGNILKFPKKPEIDEAENLEHVA